MKLLICIYMVFWASAVIAEFRPKLPFQQGQLRNFLNQTFYTEEMSWPSLFEFEGERFFINYTFDLELENLIKKEIKRFRPDYVSVVAINNNDGSVLASLDYDRALRKFGKSLTYSSSHPAASVFKIVTAAALLEGEKVDPETNFKFRGRSTTLYRSQLRSPKGRRWVRNQSFRYAFALSNNVIFGRAAIDFLNGQGLVKIANNLGFNQSLMENVSLSRSFVSPPISLYNMAEVASGFNRKTLISPIHGALLAGMISRNGIELKPHIVKSIKNIESQEVFEFRPFKQRARRVLSKETAKELSEMMQLTLKRGTARSAFRRFLRSRNGRNYKVGGKTGTITGGLPYGKRDWFVSYMKPTNSSQDKGISLCVMIINKKKWYVRSAELAKRIMLRYIRLNRNRS